MTNGDLLPAVNVCGWRSFFFGGTLRCPYNNRDPKRDHNFDLNVVSPIGTQR